MACKQNFYVDQGSDFIKQLMFKNRETGEAIDLSASTFAGMVKVDYDDASPTMEFSFNLNNAAAGEIYVYMTAAETAQLGAITYLYDIERTEGGIVTRIMEGKLIVTPEVTK